jgi:hypothetical protein
MAARDIEVSSVQTNFLQEPESHAEPDSREMRGQPSLFSELLFSNLPASEAPNRKPTGYKFQTQLAFDFTDSGPPPDEAQEAVSRAA